MLTKNESLGKVLLTGANGFTGLYLSAYLKESGFNVFILKSDLTNAASVNSEIKKVSPDYVIHLAGVSFVGEKNSEKIYRVNVLGTENLLLALSSLKIPPQKIILASSASVYGNQTSPVLSEEMRPNPVGHYALSKLNMELLSKNMFSNLEISNVRLFNYTGIGQNQNFIIPKLVSAYQRRDKFIELGNINVQREFNDIRDVVNIYLALLQTSKKFDIVNICSSRSVSLSQIINSLNSLSGYNIEVRINEQFVRKNEVWELSGSIEKLSSLIDLNFKYEISDTIEWMYK